MYFFPLPFLFLFIPFISIIAAEPWTILIDTGWESRLGQLLGK